MDLERPVRIEGGTVAGIVTDFSGVPLTGVRVEAAATGGGELDLLPVLTDGEGRFRLEGLAEGRYDLRFLLGRVKARTLAVPTGTDQLRVRLARPQGILLVVRPEPGYELPDLIHVVLERETPVKRVREYIGRMLKRRVLLWSIRPGRYVMTVWGGAFLPVTVHGIDVREKEPAPEVEVILSALGATVDGQVFAADGSTARAHVAWRRLDRAGHAPRHETTHVTDDLGRFLFRGLPGGRYRFTVWQESSGHVVDQELDVPEQKTTVLRVDLPA